MLKYPQWWRKCFSYQKPKNSSDKTSHLNVKFWPLSSTYTHGLDFAHFSDIKLGVSFYYTRVFIFSFLLSFARYFFLSYLLFILSYTEILSYSFFISFFHLRFFFYFLLNRTSTLFCFSFFCSFFFSPFLSFISISLFILFSTKYLFLSFFFKFIILFPYLPLFQAHVKRNEITKKNIGLSLASKRHISAFLRQKYSLNRTSAFRLVKKHLHPLIFAVYCFFYIVSFFFIIVFLFYLCISFYEVEFYE